MSKFRKCPRCKCGVAVDHRYVDGGFIPHCGNCGEPLRITKARLTTSHDYVTKEATTDKGMSARNRAAFHYLNPNGLVKTKLMLDAEISALVEAKIIPSGWIIAYGTFDTFCADSIRSLCALRRPKVRDVRVAINMLADRNAIARRHIDEVKNATTRVEA